LHDPRLGLGFVQTAHESLLHVCVTREAVIRRPCGIVCREPGSQRPRQKRTMDYTENTDKDRRQRRETASNLLSCSYPCSPCNPWFLLFSRGLHSAGQDEIDDPAPRRVLGGRPAVAQDLRRDAPGLLEGVAEDGQQGEIRLPRDPLRQGNNRRREQLGGEVRQLRQTASEFETVEQGEDTLVQFRTQGTGRCPDEEEIVGEEGSRRCD